MQYILSFIEITLQSVHFIHLKHSPNVSQSF